MNTIRMPRGLVSGLLSKLMLGLLSGLLIAACQQESASTPDTGKTPIATSLPAEVEPLLAEYRAPELTNLQTADQVQATCAAEIGRLDADILRLEAFGGKPDVETYLEAVNGFMVSAGNLASTAGTVSAVHPDALVRTAADACSQSLSPVFSSFSLSRGIYERIGQIDVTSAEPETRRFIDKLALQFRLAGVDKDEGTRARIRELNDEITATGLKFDENIRDDVGYLILDSVEQLRGLPQDYIDAHPPGEDGKIRVSTQYPDLFPFMTYADDDALRRELSVINNNLAHPENQEVLEKLLALRHEFALLLGFNNFAEWATADKMVGSPQRVEGFLEELAGYTAEPQDKEYALLLARLQQDQPGAERVESWQNSYLLNKVVNERFKVDAKEVRQYFRFNNTRDGLLVMVQDLFNVQIKPWTTNAWHADAETYELWDGDRLLGHFYLDLHPREGKYQHAAVFPMRNGISGVQTPLAALVCNFPSGDGLMEHGDVETFLHEFGHLIHYLFAGDHHWSDISGISTEWDFVEAPSQMLEEWVWDYDTVSPFAKNAAGETLPRDLLERMRAARDFGLGMTTRRQVSLAAMSLGLYNRDPAGLDLKAFTDEMSRKYTRFEPLPEGHFYAGFGHLNGYSAIYYTYQWSLAIATDLFTRFDAEGLRNVETAGEYRDRILAPGGAKPAAELVRDFLGRDISFKPYADRLSQAANAEPVAAAVSEPAD